MIPIPSINIYHILRASFGGLVPKLTFNHILNIADTSYLSVDGNWVRDMVLHDPILLPNRYRRDIFDCDDYVLYLKTKIGLYAANTPNISRPFAVGYILTDKHAFNFGINALNQIFILNTQSENRDLVTPDSAENCAAFLQLSNINSIKNIYI